MGRNGGHPWGETMAAIGEIQWPPMGSFPWPPSLSGRAKRSLHSATGTSPTRRLGSLGRDACSLASMRRRGRILTPDGWFHERAEASPPPNLTSRTAPSIEHQRPYRDRQAAESPRRCSSKHESGKGSRATGRAERRLADEQQPGVSAAARSLGQSAHNRECYRTVAGSDLRSASRARISCTERPG